MPFISATTNNNGIQIHYYDSINYADHNLTPLLICPGLSETAEEYYDLLEFIFPRRGIALSFRGRGRSETPQTGYNLEEHVSDIEAVVEATGINEFHLLGISRGVSYALGYARKNENKIKSLLINDYPAEHRQMPHNWPDEYIHDYLIPFHRTDHIRPEVVQSIQRESQQTDLAYKSNYPVLVLRGGLEGSLLNETDLIKYRNMYSNLRVKKFDYSEHNIITTERELLYNSITDFLSSSEKRESIG
ncbi:alpha/beta fold hydrolase [Paenibacillus mendelii]|uniref:Alpha/beta fold hydrolase n=1 Tax=Paenibacillus mendelii TaxID=206163 RepID=A0ABV6JES7_9BACL|nr:alpha/beta hydrolase [Paenibacillus mendelii]MCQ6557291.1 alpha/beta hydrolase [Paenibacillus mendelii]